MKKKQKLVVMLFLAITGMANAQYVVTGQLLSAKDHQPIPFANIAMMRAADTTFLRGVITDDGGVFNINNDISTYCILGS